jgi:integrase
MSENAMTYALNRAGFQGKHCSHGWRSSFSTIMNEEEEGFEIIETSLAHVVGNAVSRAYNRNNYIEKRKELMQRWADMIFQGLVSLPDIQKRPCR